jgi:hypothetical protein
LDLTIRLTEISDPGFAAICSSVLAKADLICDRCQVPQELVVAVLEIVGTGTTWALCGLCMREIPAGFHVAQMSGSSRIKPESAVPPNYPRVL